MGPKKTVLKGVKGKTKVLEATKFSCHCRTFASRAWMTRFFGGGGVLGMEKLTCRSLFSDRNSYLEEMLYPDVRYILRSKGIASRPLIG